MGKLYILYIFPYVQSMNNAHRCASGVQILKPPADKSASFRQKTYMSCVFATLSLRGFVLDEPN